MARFTACPPTVADPARPTFQRSGAVEARVRVSLNPPAALVAPASSDPDERESFQFDLGQAAMSLMLAAADLGVGSCHAAVADQAMARELLGLPEDRECMWLIALGFPADRPLTPIERPNRRPFDDVVHRERW